MGFSELLLLALIILKLTGNIDWSWWWVLAPFWISILVYIAVFAALIKRSRF